MLFGRGNDRARLLTLPAQVFYKCGRCYSSNVPPPLDGRDQMKKLMRLAAMGLPLMLVLASAALAQTQITTGVIQGTTLDEQGGAVPGASVEVKNVDTNFSRTLTTDSDGRFVFLQLRPG